MNTVITFANHKGGVGKTASVASIGSVMAASGFKVLMMDLDTQSNLTLHFLKQVPKRTIYHAFLERREPPIHHVRENLDLVPSSLDMAGIETKIVSMRRREFIMSDLLCQCWDQYDYILIDCPPSLGAVTMNALAVAKFVVVPMLADLMSSYGLDMMCRFCVDLQDINPGLCVNYIFFNKYEKNLKMTKAIENSVRAKFGFRVLNTVIHKNTDIAQAPLNFTDVLDFKPDSKGAKDYQALTEELLSRMRKDSPYYDSII